MKLLLIAALTVIDPTSAVRPDKTITEVLLEEFPNGTRCVVEFSPEELQAMGPGPIRLRADKILRCNDRGGDKKKAPKRITV